MFLHIALTVRDLLEWYWTWLNEMMNNLDICYSSLSIIMFKRTQKEGRNCPSPRKNCQYIGIHLELEKCSLQLIIYRKIAWSSLVPRGKRWEPKGGLYWNSLFMPYGFVIERNWRSTHAPCWSPSSEILGRPRL